MAKQIIEIGDTGAEVIAKLANNFTLAIDLSGGLFSLLPKNDGSSDHAEIQAVIDAAAAVRGTVKLGAGDWYITSSVILKSNIRIEVERGAIFTFPSGYTGKMWTNNGELLIHCSVVGGRYVGYNEANPLWDCIDLVGTDYTTAYVMNCRFDDIWVQNARNGIYIAKTNIGWVDGNRFNDIFTWNCVNGINSNRSAESGGGIDSNSWSNIIMQAGANTEYGINLNTRAAYWTFTNVLLIDFVEEQIPFYFGELTENIIFHGTIPGPLPSRHSPTVNLGLQNIIMTNKTFEIAKRIINTQITAALTDDNPTAAEINAATGLTPLTAGAGYQCTIKDSSGSGLSYKVESDGTNWSCIKMTLIEN